MDMTNRRSSPLLKSTPCQLIAMACIKGVFRSASVAVAPYLSAEMMAGAVDLQALFTWIPSEFDYFNLSLQFRHLLQMHPILLLHQRLLLSHGSQVSSITSICLFNSGTCCKCTQYCCSTNACCCGSNSPTVFAIHGLWPDYNDGT